MTAYEAVLLPPSAPWSAAPSAGIETIVAQPAPPFDGSRLAEPPTLGLALVGVVTAVLFRQIARMTAAAAVPAKSVQVHAKKTSATKPGAKRRRAA